MANRRKPNPAQVLGPPAPPPPEPVNQPQPPTPRQKHHLYVTKRQNELLTHGYTVATDGVWGPETQQAWSHYTYWKRRGQPYHGLDLKSDRAKNLAEMFGTTGDQKTVQHAHDLAASKGVGIAAARSVARIAKTTIKEAGHGDGTPAQVATTIARAEADRLDQQINGWRDSVRKNPASASKLTLTQLAHVLDENADAASIPSTSPTGATAIQSWLTSHGYSIKTTGKFDVQTHDALQKAFIDQQAKDRAKTVETLIHDLYNPYGLTPGQDAAWWPSLEKKIPTPLELAKILEQGGPMAMAVDRVIRKQIIEPRLWSDTKLTELYGLSRRLQLEPGKDMILGGTADTIYQDVLAANADPKFKAEVTALWTSKTPAEFQSRILAISTSKEYEAKASSQSWLDSTLAGFSDVMHHGLKPGEWTRMAIVKDGLDIVDFGKYVVNGFKDPVYGSQFDPSNLHTSTNADAEAFIHGLPGYVRIPFEMVVDPINFFAPLKLGSTALRLAGLRAFGGYVARDTAELSLRHSEGLIAKAFGLTYEKGTWSKLALPRAIDKHIVAHAIANQPVALKVADVIKTTTTTIAKKATAIKPDVIAAVRADAVLAGRHLYTSPKIQKLTSEADEIAANGVKAAGEAIKLPKFQSAPADVVKANRAARDAAKVALVKHPRYKVVVDALTKAQAAIYVTTSHEAPSSVGASMIARHEEEARIQSTFAVAQDVHDRVLWYHSPQGWGQEAEHLQKRLKAAWGAGDEAAARSASHDVKKHLEIRQTPGSHTMTHADATKLAQEEFDKVVHTQAAYITGGVDKKLTFPTFTDDEVKKGVLKEITRRQRAIMDQWETVILPALHELVQDNADVIGKPLWDSTGRWVGRGALEQRILRDLGQQAFDPNSLIDVANPAFNLAHTLTEMHEAIADEVKRVSARLHWRAARDQAVGDKTVDVEARIDEAKKEIQSHWHKNPSDGNYYDDRATVKVPDLYVRHMRESIDKAKAIRPGASGLGEIAQGSRHTGPIDNAIGAMIWDLGGRTRVRNAYFDSGHPRSHWSEQVVNEETAAAKEAEFAASNDLHDAVTAGMVAHAKGFDHSVSKGFLKEGALMLALQHAQSAPLRFSYRGMKGALDTWVFLTLPLRPGWVARNVADNVVKTFMAGVHDPRLFFQGFEQQGRVAGKANTVFEANIAHVRSVVGWMDKLQGTNALKHFDNVIDHFWRVEAGTLRHIFNAHGVDVDEKVIDNFHPDVFSGRQQRRPVVHHVDDQQLAEIHNRDPELADVIRKMMKTDAKATVDNWKDKIWHLMGALPEDYFKRVIYRDTVRKTLRKLEHTGMSEVDKQAIAMENAIASIEKHLFDYSKVSVIEDNFRAFYPFIQFWRKNTAFWATSFVNHPWLPADLQKWQDDRADANKDWPSWMKRYVSSSEVVDAAAVVPGLAPLVSMMLPDGAMADPLNYTSFGKLYKIFKGENPDLPPDKQGWKIIGPLFDYMDNYGPGLNPLVRKPLEDAGVANMQAWKTIIPEAGPAIALTRDWWTTQHTGPQEWARIIGLAAMGVSSDRIAKDFDYWVNMEMAGQEARGETLDRKTAEATIRKWFILQNLYGYFTGTYFRRANPQDIHLSKMWEYLTDPNVSGDVHKARWEHLTPKQAQMMALWAKRKMNRQSFMEYVALAPVIEAYFRQKSWAASEAYKQAHPEIIQFVDPAWNGKPFDSLAKNVNTAINTGEFFQVTKLYDDVNVDYDVRQQATNAMLTPALKKAWDKNGTPAKRRRQAIQGEIHKQLQAETDTFFAIPDKDYDAKDAFLKAHPEMAHSWVSNNSLADDFGGILHGANANLRKQFFALVDANKYDEVDAFLKEHPYIWEDTKKAYEFDPETGQKKLLYLHGKARATAEAKPQLDIFFKLLDQVGKKKAFEWLYRTHGDTQDVVKHYFRTWGKHKMDQETQDAFDVYDFVPKDQRGKWLRANSAAAEKVKAYWYAHATPTQRKQTDALDTWSSLPKDKQQAWLHGGSEKANIVRRFLWSHATPEQHKVTLALDYYNTLKGEAKIKWRQSNDPRAKLVHDFFWKHMTPAERHVSTLVDHYFKLSAEARVKWMHSGSADAKAVKHFFWKHQTPAERRVGGLVEKYFAMDKDARVKWLHSGSADAKAVKAFFYKHQTPAERQTSAALETYFALPATERSHWLKNHFTHQADLVARYFAKHETKAQKVTRAALKTWSQIDVDHRDAWLHDGSPAAQLVLKFLRANETVKERDNRIAMEAYRAIKDKAKRQHWLDGPSTQARLVRSQFARMDLTRTHRAVDYQRVKPTIEAWRKMPPAERRAYLHASNEKAQSLRDYFDKYGRDADADQHALDYYDVKDSLAAYGKMTEDQKRAWLNGGTKEADALLDYFKKYTKTHQYERAFYKAHPDLVNGTPAQYARLRFWKAYFALTPDQRPAFIDDEAEKAGVFVYGEFGAEEMRDKANDFHRFTGKLTEKQTAYLYAKPLIDFYYTLPADQRSFFLQVNPEAADYFAKYAHKSLTGDPKLDAKMETYFGMAPYGTTRTTYLAENPDVAAYFDKHQKPQQRAIHQLLDFYFALPFSDRAEYADKHPELTAYFDRQKMIRDNYKQITNEFDLNDPRLKPYFADGEDMEAQVAFEKDQLRQGAIRALSPEGISTGHGDRQPYKASTSKHGDSRGNGVKKLPKGWIQDGRQRRV